MNTLIISNNTISYNHQVINTSNISSINLKQTTEKQKQNHILSAIGIFLIIYSIFYTLEELPDFFKWEKIEFSGYVIWLLLKPLVSLILGISLLKFNKRQNKKKTNKTTYYLHILTNAGSIEFFTSIDYNFINGIRLNIQEAIDRSLPSSITYNMDNKTIINNKGDVIINASIYEGVSKEDIEFLTSKFETAIKSLQESIVQSNDKESIRNFDTFKEELSTSKPRQTILKAAWQSLSTIANISEVAQVIEKGISMF